MRVLCCGDRNWKNEMAIYNRLAGLKGEVGELTVIEGGAKGADRLAWNCAWKLSLPVETFPADWKALGRLAGPIRNRAMLDSGVDLVLAFHNDLASSRGTRDCVLEAERRGIPVEVIVSG